MSRNLRTCGPDPLYCSVLRAALGPEYSPRWLTHEGREGLWVLRFDEPVAYLGMTPGNVDVALFHLVSGPIPDQR